MWWQANFLIICLTSSLGCYAWPHQWCLLAYDCYQAGRDSSPSLYHSHNLETGSFLNSPLRSCERKLNFWKFSVSIMFTYKVRHFLNRQPATVLRPQWPVQKFPYFLIPTCLSHSGNTQVSQGPKRKEFPFFTHSILETFSLSPLKATKAAGSEVRTSTQYNLSCQTEHLDSLCETSAFRLLVVLLVPREKWADTCFLLQVT